ncbi:MAG: N-acetylmuramoyl-L-alanine amidase [Armatimonadetes bacterium]|nr:N-acetylmuramoyl-L-alanine amidase [Armatimonadota bacterium]
MRRPASKKKPVVKKKVSKALPPLHGVIVIIDPGHGGTDPGASVGGVTEAMLTYRMAATLAEVVKKLGAEVHFTVRSAALRRKPIEPPKLSQPEGKKTLKELSRAPEPPLLAPRDAVLASGRRLDMGNDVPEFLHARAEIGARFWKRRKPHVVFLSLHFDVSKGSPSDHGGFTMWDIREDHPPMLVREITRRFGEAGLCGNRHKQPRPNDLGVTNPEFNPVPQKTLVELATLTNAADHKNALDPRWRWRVARILAASIVACKKAKVI